LENKDKNKLKVLTIGDSFYYMMRSTGFQYNVYEDAEYWYYNKTILPTRDKDVLALDTDLKEELKDIDTVVLICTEAAIHQLGWGFIGKAHEAYELD